MEKEDGLSLLLVSCDKYMDIVRVFEQSAVKYWPDCPYKKYLLTESVGCWDEGTPGTTGTPHFFENEICILPHSPPDVA